jgi:hypothetical protein
MTPARCPLVREIEDDPGLITGEFLTTSNWERLRAALEAAEEMAQNAPCAIASPSLWAAAERYRAATRGS